MTNYKIFWHNEDFRYRFHKKTYDCPMHIHQHAEFVYIFSGEIELVVSDKKYILKEGDAALIFPWQLHGFFGDKSNSIFICVFAEKFIPELYNINRNSIPDCNKFISDSLTASMLEKLSKCNEYTQYEIKSLLYNAIGTFLLSTNLVEKKKESEAVNKIISYSVQNISSDLDLSIVAEALGYSRNYLSHIIKNTIGINFRSLLNCIKFEISKNLLINTDKAITEIAYLSGYGTERSFNRNFKNLSGITPKEYRNR